MKDQQLISASASNTNLLALAHNSIQGNSAQDLLNVTPFLKPTERNP